MIWCTIPKRGETWVCRCGPPPRSSRCQGRTWTHWYLQGSLPSALCQNWTGLFSCCNCPGEVDEKLLPFMKTFRNRSLQLSSSDSSKQFEVWSQLWNMDRWNFWRKINKAKNRQKCLTWLLTWICSNRCSMLMHWPSLQVNSPSGLQPVSFSSLV